MKFEECLKDYNKLYSDVNIHDKQLEYCNYIIEHKNNVKRAWEEFKIKAKHESIIHDDYQYWTMNELVDNHDSSKFSSEEFESYRKQFYPINQKEKDDNELEFEKAWKHHYNNNPHHWQYYFSEDKNQEYSYCHFYIIEMMLDWQAMGYKFGGDAYTYYQSNKNKIKIPIEYQDYFEYMLKYFVL